MDISRHEPVKILSNAVVHGNVVYLAGLVADDANLEIRDQTKQVLEKIDRLLAQCGSNKSRLLSATIWLPDIYYRAPMNEVWIEWVDPKNLPVRACVEARLANPKLLVEIMVTAALTAGSLAASSSPKQ